METNTTDTTTELNGAPVNGSASYPESETERALASLVENIGRGLARGLVDAVRELQGHIVGETRKVGDSMDRRLDALQESMRVLTDVVSSQNAMGVSVQDQCRELAEVTAALRECDARRAGEMESLQGRVDTVFAELGMRQEELSAVRSTLTDVTVRMDSFGERLDRQADALRSMYSTYAQRETELEQVVEGLVRLRSHSVCAPASAL